MEILTLKWIAVFVLALVVLGFGISHCGIAASLVDPINKIPAQDEAVYANTAIHMAADGDWISPKFLGRYAFYKPPLLYWTTAIGVKLFGPSLVSLRLPSLIAGALTALLVFGWLCRFRGMLAGSLGVLLVLSDHLLHVMSRVMMCDALLVFWITAAMGWVAYDPGLRRRGSPWIFGALAGLAIMTKGVAGVLPLLALVLYWILAPPKDRPRARAVGLAFAAAAAVGGPW
ncbi:MAG: phospholipid carrier-dependent glycosyltransferase, partial [Bryobacteraceae bacterium]